MVADITQTQGTQVYMRVHDSDGQWRSSADELIDSFSIDVEQIPIGEETKPQVYSGTFGFAFSELSFRVECYTTHYYPYCDPGCVKTNNCTCMPGYAGPTCSYPVRNCKLANCPNNSRCERVRGQSLYTCTCLDGFVQIGDKCAEGSCNRDLCSGHGECEDYILGKVRCVCKLGYNGTQCETDIDDCEGVNCSGHRECLDKVNAYECSCDNRYFGTDCELSVCTSITCSRHGRCELADETGFKCYCDEGYTGSLCEREAGVCNCSDTQLCEQESGRCVCRPQYTGEQCQTPIGCLDVDCNGSGTCVLREDGSLGCDCYTGYTGDFCKHHALTS